MVGDRLRWVPLCCLHSRPALPELHAYLCSLPEWLVLQRSESTSTREVYPHRPTWRQASQVGPECPAVHGSL